MISCQLKPLCLPFKNSQLVVCGAALPLDAWNGFLPLEASSPSNEVVSAQTNCSFSFWVVPKREVYLRCSP